jgi:ubiquinone/menaquinone biosynthesis C-methylase UbiE
MDALGIAEGSVVADLGAGSGWFTLRLANRVGPNGRVFAEDIQPQMVEVIKRRMARENLQQRVVVKLGTAEDLRLPENVLDAALICDAYHEMDQPVALLRSAARALKKDGRIGIIEFTKAGGGPGPPIEDRVEPERVIREARAAGLRLLASPNFLRYQYMLVFGKSETVAMRSR